MYVGIWPLEGTVYFQHQARNGSNVPTAATGNVTYRVYDLPNETPLLTGNATGPFDAANCTGCYLVSFTAAGGSGFDRGKNYTVRVEDTTAGDQHAEPYILTVV